MANQEFLKLLNDYATNPARTMTEWQRQLNHILKNLNNGTYVGTDATYVLVTDALGYFVGVNVEEVLAEIANSLLGGEVRVTTLTGTTLLTTAQFGLVICNSAGAMDLNLPTCVGSEGFGYRVNNIGAGTVTINPDGAELLQTESTFDLYQDEILVFTSDNGKWVLS
jgi:hypothetical protein